MDILPQNKQVKKKLKPFTFMIDGYFSVAEEIVTIYKNSRQFTLTEYEGRDEFYQKYFDYYEVLLAEVMLCDISKSMAGPQCLKDLDEFLREQIDQHTITFTMFLYAYSTLLYHIDRCRDKKPRISFGVVGCNAGFGRIKEKMLSNENKNLMLVPVVTPRGLYGINTFLYCYFNGMFPIGITTNPIAVHGNEVGDTAAHYISHDLAHYGIVSDRSEDYQVTEYPAYRYVLQNQENIGVERCKGLLFAMFFIIHENEELGLNESLRIINRYWYDWWNFVITNEYYTPETFGITFPSEVFPDEPINIKDCNSINFQNAMSDNEIFNKNVHKYLESFVIATYEDYMELKESLLEDI